MLGKLPNYSELTVIPFGYYNSMSSANKAIIDTALLRPVIYNMLDNSNAFERRVWAVTGDVYMGYYLINGTATVVLVSPDNISSSYQNFDCVYLSTDKYCGVATKHDAHTFQTTHREGYYYRVADNTAPFVSSSSYMPQYNNLEEILLDADSMFPALVSYPITYYPTNVTLSPAPSEAAVGDTVTVGVTVPDGYSIIDPSSNIVVRNNGVIVPHVWNGTNSQFTFIMPDPS